MNVFRTGLSIVRAGAWAAANHGGRGWRGWRKLHRGVDQSGVILVHPDASPVPPVAVWAPLCGGLSHPRLKFSGGSGDDYATIPDDSSSPSIAAAKVTPRDSEKEAFIVVSMYARWLTPQPSTKSRWRVGYPDVSAHRIISDLCVSNSQFSGCIQA